MPEIEVPEINPPVHQTREQDLDAVIEIYRAAKQLGKLGLYLLYVTAAVLGIIISIKKLLQ